LNPGCPQERLLRGQVNTGFFPVSDLIIIEQYRGASVVTACMWFEVVCFLANWRLDIV